MIKYKIILDSLDDRIVRITFNLWFYRLHLVNSTIGFNRNNDKPEYSNTINIFMFCFDKLKRFFGETT